ncbi:MAG: ASCH domain-containing protein [Pseudomonadota bacterium]
MPYLVEGSRPPDHVAIKAFFEQARAMDETLPEDYQVRWIGGDSDTTEAILAHIVSGEKTGTVSLPWVAERRGCAPPKSGDAMVLIHFDGSPAIVLRIIDVKTVAYQDIRIEHTSLDGPAVRALDIWMPIHTRYFEMLLQPYELEVTGDMPVWFETFSPVYPKATS